MTRLNKPVRRLAEESIIRDAGKLKPLVVTFYPGGFLGLRFPKSRKEELVTLTSCYKLAVMQRIAAERRDKAEAKKAKRYAR